jgi:hypothetical protein
MRIAKKPYIPDATYWLLVGKNSEGYIYKLLGKFIDGKFEFRNEQAIDGYIFRDDLSEKR